MKYEALKPPIELIRKGFDDGEKVVAYACGTCGRVSSKDLVESCCARRWCDCGTEIESKGYTACRECIYKRCEERKEARKAKAEKISPRDYDGPVWWDEGDQLCSNFDDAVDTILDDEENGPLEDQTIWACVSKNIALDASDILEAALEDDHHEDAADNFDQAAEDDLAELLKGWNERWADHVTTWFEDDTRLIVVEPEQC
jgi:hypothetical protein